MLAVPYCRECGAQVAEDTLFCDACGREIAEQWFCKECGRQISEEQYKTAKGYCGICEPKVKETPRKQAIKLAISGLYSTMAGVASLSLTIANLVATPLWMNSSTQLLGFSGLVYLTLGVFLLALYYLESNNRMRIRNRTVNTFLVGIIVFSVGTVVYILTVYAFLPISGLFLGLAFWLAGCFVIVIGTLFLKAESLVIVKR